MIAGLETRPPLAAIQPLLDACGLTADDLTPPLPPETRFLGVSRDGQLVACVGLEYHGRDGLLRSLAVAPAYRGQGLAGQLLTFAEALAYSRHVDRLFLLTGTAAAFFAARGYVETPRADAPAAIRATAQFARLCPASAALLQKSLAGPALQAAAYRPPGGLGSNF